MQALVRFDPLQHFGIGFRVQVRKRLALSRIYRSSLDAATIRLSVRKVSSGKDRLRSVFLNAEAVLFVGVGEFAVQNEFRIRFHRGYVPGIQCGRIGEGKIAFVRFSKLVVGKTGDLEEFGFHRIRNSLKRERRFAHAYALFVFSGGAEGSGIFEQVVEISRREIRRRSKITDGFVILRKRDVGPSDEVVGLGVFRTYGEHEFSSRNDLFGRGRLGIENRMGGKIFGSEYRIVTPKSSGNRLFGSEIRNGIPFGSTLTRNGREPIDDFRGRSEREFQVGRLRRYENSCEGSASVIHRTSFRSSKIECRRFYVSVRQKGGSVRNSAVRRGHPYRRIGRVRKFFSGNFPTGRIRCQFREFHFFVRSDDLENREIEHGIAHDGFGGILVLAEAVAVDGDAYLHSARRGSRFRVFYRRITHENETVPRKNDAGHAQSASFSLYVNVHGRGKIRVRSVGAEIGQYAVVVDGETKLSRRTSRGFGARLDLRRNGRRRRAVRTGNEIRHALSEGHDDAYEGDPFPKRSEPRNGRRLPFRPYGLNFRNAA